MSVQKEGLTEIEFITKVSPRRAVHFEAAAKVTGVKADVGPPDSLGNTAVTVHMRSGKQYTDFWRNTIGFTEISKGVNRLGKNGNEKIIAEFLKKLPQAPSQGNNRSQAKK